MCYVCVLILGEKCVFSAALNFSPLSNRSWRLSGRVPGHRADNRKRPTTELAATSVVLINDNDNENPR